MDKHTAKAVEDRVISESRTALDELLREGARRMLQAAIENEVQEHLARSAHLWDETGRRQVVGNGSLPEQALVTGVGPVRIQQPRVRDRRPGHRFTSRILPPFMRRVLSIN